MNRGEGFSEEADVRKELSFVDSDDVVVLDSVVEADKAHGRDSREGVFVVCR